MSAPGQGAPTLSARGLWEATGGDPVGGGGAVPRTQVDLAVIGGGFTGCAAALAAAEAGARVALLEAETIGHGGSGRNVGLVNAGLWTPPGDVERLIGVEAGARLNGALALGPAAVFALVNRHGIPCEARRAGTLHLAAGPRARADLDRRARQLEARGAPVRLLDRDETARRTGSPRFAAALFDPRAGVVQPLAFVRGLARAAIAQGATVLERTPARVVSREKSYWFVETEKGAFTAAALLLATNAYHQRATGAPAPVYTPVGYFQVATAPLSAEARRAILPGGEGAWDAAKVMSSFRLDAAGRLLVGGVGALSRATAAIHVAWARRKIAWAFPELGAVEIEHAWSGRIAMTSDHLPQIATLGETPPGLSVYGYSGRGIGPGVVFGRAAARALLGVEDA